MNRIICAFSFLVLGVLSVKGARLDHLIEPGKTLYGLPWTVSVEKFVERFGEPASTLKLPNDEVALVYGRQHLFVFRKDVLRKVVVDTVLISEAFKEFVPAHPVLDRIRPELSPGIRIGMDVEKLKQVGRPRYVDIRDDALRVSSRGFKGTTTIWFTFVVAQDRAKTTRTVGGFSWEAHEAEPSATDNPDDAQR